MSDEMVDIKAARKKLNELRKMFFYRNTGHHPNKGAEAYYRMMARCCQSIGDIDGTLNAVECLMEMKERKTEVEE